MARYLNGFTIVSFNHRNKYVSFKTENYFIDEQNSYNEQSKMTYSLNRKSYDNLNNENNNTDSNTSREFWIIEDSSGEYKLKYSNNSEGGLPVNIKAGPIYDMDVAMLLLNYFNDMELLK